MIRHLHAAAALIAAGATVLSLDAQTPSPAQTQPVFRAGIDLVQVDVSVLDRNHRPIRDLTVADFTLLENGKPQDIAAFAAIALPAYELPAAPWIRDVPPDVRTTDLGEARLVAIVMDDAAMPGDLQMAQGAKKIGLRIIDGLGPADLAAVIFTRDNRHAQDFTTDRGRLREAINKFTPGSVYIGTSADGLTDSYHFTASIRTLNRVSEYLATVPQRRKTVIYVSTGVPVDLERASEVVLIGPGVSIANQDATRELADALRSMNRVQADYALNLRDALVRAQHGNVNVYSVDPGGLGGMQAYFQNRRVLGPNGPMAVAPLDAMTRANLHRDYLRTVAENSGGRAILDTNDLNGAVDQIFRENSSYYLLGYRSTREPSDRRVRQVNVKVRTPGATAHTRSAYYDPKARPADLPADPSLRLSNALTGILPSPDIELSATVAPFALPGKRDAGLAIVLGVRQPVPPGDYGARVKESVELLTRAFTPTGDARGSTSATAQVTFRAGVAETGEFDILSRIDLLPGRYQLRLAAHSTALNKSGSVYYDVDIPDFTGDRIQLSGIVVGVKPGPIAAPPDALNGLTPIVPTSRRAFAATDAATAFLQIYSGARRPGSPISFEMRVTNDENRVVFRRSDNLAFERFDERRIAPYLFDLPLARLASGAYLLTFEAGLGGQSVRRDLRFEVK